MIGCTSADRCHSLYSYKSFVDCVVPTRRPTAYSATMDPSNTLSLVLVAVAAVVWKLIAEASDRTESLVDEIAEQFYAAARSAPRDVLRVRLYYGHYYLLLRSMLHSRGVLSLVFQENFARLRPGATIPHYNSLDLVVFESDIDEVFATIEDLNATTPQSISAGNRIRCVVECILMMWFVPPLGRVWTPVAHRRTTGDARAEVLLQNRLADPVSGNSSE